MLVTRLGQNGKIITEGVCTNCKWYKQEIAANCEKYIRAKDTQVCLMNFSSEFKLVKPFVFLSFIFESTARYRSYNTLVTAMLL